VEGSASSLHPSQSTSPSSSKPIFSLDNLESMVDTGSFDSLPSLPQIIDDIQPLLDDEESADVTTSQELFTRLRAALMKKLDHDQEANAADKAEKKKRKETHSVTVGVCAHLTLHVYSLLHPRTLFEHGETLVASSMLNRCCSQTPDFAQWTTAATSARRPSVYTRVATVRVFISLVDVF
jgi:hypothetical protein